MLNGFSSNLPADTIIESGVVFDDLVAIGAIVGGVRFDPGKELRNVEYDGKRSDVQSLDRIVTYRPVLAFAMIEFGGPASGGQIARLEPGNTYADTGGVNSPKGTIRTFTPKAAGAYLASGDYVTNLRAIFERHNGGYVAILFAIALCRKYDLAGQDKNEGRVNAEFQAMLSQSDAASSPGKCPYVIELRSALPS